MAVRKAWAPSELERRCLRQLDAPNSWKVLNRETPEKTDVLPWSYFRGVFVFNFTLFGAVLALIFFAVEASAGSGLAEIREDLPFGGGAVAFLALALGLYATNLYRRSWNGRARSLT